MNVNPAASNPILYYKLDPGEWGSSAPASAGQSVAHVSGHESANLLRFENQAAKKGCYVVAKDLYLNFSKNGIYLAATSGRSQAITYCPKKDKNQIIKNNIKTAIDKKIASYSKQQLELEILAKTSKDNASRTIFEEKLKEIRDRKLLLEQKKLRIYTQLTLLLAQNINVSPQLLNINIYA
ncbi:hypothetical protein [Hippea jasoniae]|uniref:hypothetical protein n=1 Tax=Hippea jasoniae TaxID=944479 RepID=UPI0006897090|nr:hypothetical protein [Hippea jasoniae]